MAIIKVAIYCYVIMRTLNYMYIHYAMNYAHQKQEIGLHIFGQLFMNSLI